MKRKKKAIPEEMSKFKHARMVAGVTQTALANAVGVKTATVSSWEKGKAKPTAPKIPKLAEALNTTPENILQLFTA